MNLEKLNEKLNKNVEEESVLINSLPFWKYFLIYIPVLFLIFAMGQFIANLFFDFPFNFKSILFQTVCFAIFFRVFHYVRKLWNDVWKNT